MFQVDSIGGDGLQLTGVVRCRPATAARLPMLDLGRLSRWGAGCVTPWVCDSGTQLSGF